MSGEIDQGEIRRLIVQEVQNQLEPLRKDVQAQGNRLRSLYSNGSGGPPGYLETARAEDREKFTQLFGLLARVAERLDIFDDFVTVHNTREEQREKDRVAQAADIASKLDNSDKKLNRRLAFGGIIISVIGVIIAGLVGYLTYRDSQRKVGDTRQPVVSLSEKPPQMAIDPSISK